MFCEVFIIFLYASHAFLNGALELWNGLGGFLNCLEQLYKTNVRRSLCACLNLTYLLRACCLLTNYYGIYITIYQITMRYTENSIWLGNLHFAFPGCCFVKYATSEEAERAIRGLHNHYTLPGVCIVRLFVCVMSLEPDPLGVDYGADWLLDYLCVMGLEPDPLGVDYGADWLLLPNSARMASRARPSAAVLNSCNYCCLFTLSLVVQAGFNCWLVGWVRKEIKNKIKYFIHQVGSSLFIKMRRSQK
jgi:hypothetical protein